MSDKAKVGVACLKKLFLVPSTEKAVAAHVNKRALSQKYEFCLMLKLPKIIILKYDARPIICLFFEN